MRITKAVITAASPTQHNLPLQSLVDRQGNDRTALQLILDETAEAGIEEVCIVVCPGDIQSYSSAAGSHANRLSFVEQDNPLGYADALARASSFVGDTPFLHLVGDHLYLSQSDRCCAKQLVDLAIAEECSVSAVQPTRENKLSFYGTVGAKRVAGRSDLYEIAKIIEKPTPTQAEQELIVAGLRSGYYLCLFGMHVLTPAVMKLLKDQLAANKSSKSPIQLAPTLSQLAQQERYLALQIEGTRYNIGEKYGLLVSQLAIGLSGEDRDQILTELVELLATKN